MWRQQTTGQNPHRVVASSFSAWDLPSGSLQMGKPRTPHWMPKLQRSSQTAKIDALGEQIAALQTKVDHLSSLLTNPVRGKITVRVYPLGEVPRLMPIPVHPNDSLDAHVVWSNAENQPIPDENTTTTWTLVDAAGNDVADGPAVTVDPADDEHVTVAGPLQGTNALPFSYMLKATTLDQAGATITAQSDSIDVDDTNPVTGVVSVTLP